MTEDHDATAPSVDNAEEHDSVTDRAESRKSARAGQVEHVLDETEALLRDQKFPVTTEELATEYADQPLDLTNETESLGSVFDRMTDYDEFDSSEEVREALYNELTGKADGRTQNEYNDERALEDVAEAEDETRQDRP
ncbi:hypothetical protein SAMN04487948_102573 [Halogranum amylolyticum]|uniref:DUF2795 domain-containing protein n=1 Tax=Halogranum amylolyticum TaxID=660520 RepID=A0A1H8PYP7_9EURY|nr:hypothetical protein [Halogranum amylolyticum]SEO47060.1 hypothetical protein SAMN04487948_102573 [Halogranum amylolyticum]